MLIPEVKHVSQQIYGGSLVLDAVEKPHEPPLVHAAMVDGPRAEMRIRQEINILHTPSPQ